MGAEAGGRLEMRLAWRVNWATSLGRLSHVAAHVAAHLWEADPRGARRKKSRVAPPQLVVA